MLHTRSIKAYLLAALFSCLSLQAHAGASLPQQTLNLAILDLNGSPFRYFHLSRYNGDVLNHREIPAGENQLKPIALVKVSLRHFHYITGLMLPKLTYTPVRKDVTAIASHVDESLMRRHIAY